MRRHVSSLLSLSSVLPEALSETAKNTPFVSSPISSTLGIGRVLDEKCLAAYASFRKPCFRSELTRKTFRPLWVLKKKACDVSPSAIDSNESSVAPNLSLRKRLTTSRSMWVLALDILVLDQGARSILP